MFHISGVVGTCLLLLSFAVSPGVSRFPATGVADATAATSAAPDLSALSGSFVENAGQVERGEVRYYAAVGRIGTGFAQSAVLHNIVEAPPPTEQAGPLLFMDRMTVPTPSPLLSGALVRVSFAGANPVRPQGRGETPTRSHFFLGDDPAMWRTNIRSYREVVYKDLYDGIDLVYRLLPDGLKSDFLVRPGADPARITMAYEGVDSLEVTPDRLILHTAAGDVTDGPLVATAGDQPVGCAFRPVGARRAGFDCRGWDGTHPLDIDPLFWASYLGGGLRDEAYAIDLDGAGNPVVAGYTYSTDFPATPGAYDVTYADFGDVFVAKLRPDGSSLLWVTYLGGGGADWGYGLALDGLGNAVVTGSTLSTDFPASPGAYDITYSGAAEAFVAKLSAGGSSLLWATFLGGGGADWGSGLALDGLGNAVVVGDTASANFPATPGAYDASFNGGPWDAFVAKLAANGSSLLWGTYLGGGDVDGGRAVALDGAGNPVVAGATFSANFPATLGAYDISSNGGGDAYVAKVGATGSSLLWATYVGGAGEDTPLAVKLDNSGNAVVAGISESTDFPTTPGAYEVTYHGGTTDGFVAKVGAAGSSLLWATYLGGGGIDFAYGVVLDGSGNAVVAGSTYSADFPATAGTYDMTLNGTTDAFVASLGAAGSSLLWATYLGGGSDERAHALALDGSGNAVLAGRTSSADFPATPGAYDVTYNGGLNDAFVANVGPAGPPPLPPLPPRRVTTTWDGASGVGLSWEAPAAAPDHYLIYRALGDPRGFGDLTRAAAYGVAYPPATAWSDLDALAGAEERYYVIRGADAAETDLSPTSNTAGVFGGTLNRGLTAISRPIEYFPWVDYAAPGEDDTLAEYTAAFGAARIEYLDTTGTWQVGTSQRMTVGNAYLVTRTLPGTFVFTGLPGSHIRYDEGPPSGFTLAEARSLTAAVAGDDVTLSWTAPASIASLASLEVWHGTARTGIFDGTAAPLVSLPTATTTFTHAGALLGGDEHYYWIVPRDLSGELAATTYSVGVWGQTFRIHDTLALPLRPDISHTVSWYADAIPGALGILWLTANGVWVPHLTAMAAGVYDTLTLLGAGHQITVAAAGRYVFVGG